MNDTVRHRIHDISDDISVLVTTAVRTSKYLFTVQFDETTNAPSCSQLLVYVRLTKNDVVKTEVLINKKGGVECDKRAKIFLHRE